MLKLNLSCSSCHAGKQFGVTDFINPTYCSEKSVVEVLIHCSSPACFDQFDRDFVCYKLLVNDQVIREMTDGGADYCFECIGLASLMQDAINSSRPVSLSLSPSG